MSDHGNWQYEARGTALPATVFDELLEQLPEGVLVADRRAKLLLANHRAERLTGLALTSAIGRDIRATLPLVELNGRSYWETENPWGGLQTRSGAPERPVTTPSGGTVLVATRHVRFADRSLSHLIVTLRDGRARERAERQMSDLIATTAHELRSPLSAIRGFSKTLRGRWDQLRDDQKHWMLEAIEADVTRLSRLVNELLDVSRIDTGRIQLRRSPIDLAQLGRERVDWRRVSGHAPGRFQFVSDDEAMTVWADSDRLTQVIDNLLDNAMKHGRGNVAVSVTRGPGDTVHLDVVDEGSGIPVEQAELIFSRFWQGSNRSGSGLGLYVVRGLVAAHGGSVEIVPSTTETRFRVSLPAGLPAHLR